jgi:hypothetical protein
MFLFFIFYVFSSTKLDNRRVEQVQQGVGWAAMGGWRWQGKGWEDEFCANNVHT